jgi:hypothetical protein
MRLELHPKQSHAFISEATEILYGGAAGGGKSHLMRVVAITLAVACPGIQIYLFRRLHGDLWKNHMEGPSSFIAFLAEFIGAKFVKVNSSDGEIAFWNGSKIFLCHCQHEKDWIKYQGAEIHVLLIDELTHFSETIYRNLRGRCRLGAYKPPAEYAHKLPLILAGANPGGVGHHWVKASFIDGVAPMSVRSMSKKEGGMLRQYIPARLDDNPSMDDDYADKLAGLGSESMIRAMLDGDWDIVAGAYFTEFSRTRHVIKPITLPPHWTRYRCFDWGSAKPFACLWIAVSDGTVSGIAKNALVVYREYYGMADGKPDVGLKMTARAVGAEIKRLDRGETTGDGGWGVADNSIFDVNGGPSQAEEMRKSGVLWRRSDKSRLAGWEQIRMRLEGDGDGNPLLLFFDTCVHIIRTLPALQHDEHNAEDVDSRGEDHAPDALRYGLMARPITRAAPQSGKPKYGTVDWLMSETGEEKSRSKYRR